MEKRFSNSGKGVRAAVRARQHVASGLALWIAAALLSLVLPAWAEAQEKLFLTAVEGAQQELLQKIRSEQVRLDVAVWFLGDGEVAGAIVAKHKAGIPVRVIGDRVAIFEADADTRRLFEYMASEGVPIRLRYHPTSFPEIMHWKCAIFVGQNTVEFGSANYTTFELAPSPWSANDFKDETAMFSNDPVLFRAFLTMFDRMWADTTAFLDWPAAYRSDTGSTWPRAMNIPPGRHEQDYETNVPGMVWSQGPELISRMVAEIESESQRIDLVSYRLTVPEITDALIRRHQAGVPVRVFIEQMQYRNAGYPEYWLVGAMVDRLWAAGIPIKQRAHQGLTHMKSLVTSRMGMFGSSNFTRFWQRDHNYFVAATAKPAVYFALRDRIDAMWYDTVNYAPFQPQRPEFVAPQSPGNGASGVATSSPLVWNRAPWAVSFDIYMGPSPGSLTLAGRVNAVVTEEPPLAYAFYPPQGLLPSTRYYWRVVARTYASDFNPSLLTTASETFTFVTSPSASPAVAGPAGCVGPSPGAGWTCVKGGWIPPGGWTPPAPTAPAPAPSPAPAPPSSTASCPGTAPVAGWVCVNGGWVPPDHPLALAAGTAPAPPPSSQPAPAPVQSTCTTIKPAANWVCVNGGWVPPDSPLALTAAASAPAPAPAPVPSLPTSPCTTPDPFVAMGGGVCVGGGWVPKGHPLAGGGT